MNRLSRLLVVLATVVTSVILSSTLSSASPGPIPHSAPGSAAAGSPAPLMLQPATNGYYWIKVLGSGKCLEDPGYSTDHVQINQWDCAYQSNEYWKLNTVCFNGCGYYQIINAFSNQCLNVQGGSLSSGAAIIQYDCGGYENEAFYFGRADSGWGQLVTEPSISSSYPDQCLAIDGQYITYQGAALVQWDCRYVSDNALFAFTYG